MDQSRSIYLSIYHQFIYYTHSFGSVSLENSNRVGIGAVARTHKDKCPRQRPEEVGHTGEAEQASWAAVQRDYEAIKQARQVGAMERRRRGLWKIRVGTWSCPGRRGTAQSTQADSFYCICF